MDFSLSSIQKHKGIPISQQIVDVMLKQIQIGQLRPGEKLPPERELAEHLGVSRGTVKTAYKKLEQMQVLQVRQGSGSFVKRDEALVNDVRQAKAVEITREYLHQLRQMGLKASEIRQLISNHLDHDARSPLDVAVIYSNTEMLLDFKRQLCVFPDISVSIFILDSITEDPDPERLLGGFSLIVTPSDCYAKVGEVLPGLRPRMVETFIAPDNETLVKITALSRESRIGIISRTNAFLVVVRDMLTSFGFRQEQILSFFEMNYTIETYFPGGIDALISFSDAHIFTDPSFTFRNEEFFAKGGSLISFSYQIERGSMLHIEERIQYLLKQKRRQSAVL